MIMNKSEEVMMIDEFHFGSRWTNGVSCPVRKVRGSEWLIVVVRSSVLEVLLHFPVAEQW